MSKKTFSGNFSSHLRRTFKPHYGLFYRIFLSPHTIGAEGILLVSACSPLQTLLLAITLFWYTDRPFASDRRHFATGEIKKARDFFCLVLNASAFYSPVWLFPVVSESRFFAVQILREVRTEEFLRILAFSLPLAVLHSCINSYYFARKSRFSIRHAVC